ncbi:MAG: hypothetical protein AAGL10_06575 [Pseudomonadota bacterium]
MKLVKLTLIAAAATTATGAYAQNVTEIDASTEIETEVEIDNSTEIEDSFDDNSERVFNDSFDDNSDNYNDSFDDNSERVFEDSFDDNSQRFNSRTAIVSNGVFGDNAIVAETTLSNVVSGVDVNFGDIEDSASFNSSLRNNGNAFRNYSGMNALNQNTGTGASQNASVNVAVARGGVDVQ